LAVAMDHALGVDEEEQGLFADMGGDLAFALYNLEMRKAKELAEEEQKKLSDQLIQAQKMEAVGRLAGGVAHDFNNMLSVILGYSETILADLNPADPIYKDLSEVKAAAERSANLTRQLLAFSRRQTIAPKVIDLKEQMKGMEFLLRRIIGEDIDLEFVFPEYVWSVSMDPSQLDQIVANLAVNARDAMPDGGKMTIEMGNITLDEAYCQDHLGFSPGEYVLLALSDNGCGMDKETLAHVFEPFFTTKGEGKGTGLGLSTVYGIVKQNNGFVNFYSELGQGTAAKIYLPRHVGEEKAQSAPTLKTGTAGGHETILLVEDEGQVRRLAKTILERSGYQVLEAGEPFEAIALCEKHPGDIHLVLTDVVMPNMNGKDLEERIRVLKPNIKSLFMSGYTANAIAHRGVLEKGIHFIQKPFSLTTLAKKVREVLDQE
jgi:signal transduction histidine kinase/CheY-like chemotaxis protein